MDYVAGLVVGDDTVSLAKKEGTKKKIKKIKDGTL